MKITEALIKGRENKLEAAKDYLKTQFIGIDDIIDKFINSVKVWYILPEIQTRPLIINLWGVTGVGKTDLVRKFVRFIDYYDRFLEIQMDSKDGQETLEYYLDNVFENPDTQGILLLDEIQRFRTIDENGHENNSNNFQDIWMLLSDGTFQSNSNVKQELLKMVLESFFWKERDDEDEEKEIPSKGKKKSEVKKKEPKYGTSYYEAANIKKLLKLPESVEEIMLMNSDQTMVLIREKLAGSETYEGKKYTKLLIIISGNLDEAFTMAGDVEDTDLDADVYHEHSKRINIVEIKKSLTKRFKPEQIARLGNIHLIYPLLNKMAYEGIIKQKVDTLINEIDVNHKIKIELDSSVYNVVYRNGVFPTQGVRPLLSTISSIIENSIPTFVYNYLKLKSKDVIKIKCIDNRLISTIKKVVVECEVPTPLEDIKSKRTQNEKAVTAVHEAGHAVLYAVLYKTAPTQIKCVTTSSETEGFIGTHITLQSKRDLESKIMMLYGGRIAEELVFGDKYIGSGASHDYTVATRIAGKMIRQLGMSNYTGSFLENDSDEYDKIMNVAKTDELLERFLVDCYGQAHKTLKNNYAFLLETSRDLFDKTELSTSEFKVIAAKHRHTINIINPEDRIEIPYHTLLMKQLNLL